MTFFQNIKLENALKDYVFPGDVTAAPVKFSGAFEAKMERFIRQKQRNYNLLVFSGRAAVAVISIALIGSFLYLVLLPHNTEESPPIEPVQDENDTPEHTENVVPEDENEDVDDFSIAGMWEFDDEDRFPEFSGTRLIIAQNHTFLCYWMFDYYQVTGTLRISEQESVGWTSEVTATLWDAEDGSVHTETRIMTLSYQENTDRIIIKMEGKDERFSYRRLDPVISEHPDGHNPSVDYRDYGIDYETTSMNFPEFPLDMLVAYYLGGDGAYSYGASYELHYRFVAYPDTVLEYIALIGDNIVRDEPAKVWLCHSLVYSSFYNDGIVGEDSFIAFLDQLEETYKNQSGLTELLMIMRSKFEEVVEEHYSQ